MHLEERWFKDPSSHAAQTNTYWCIKGQTLHEAYHSSHESITCAAPFYATWNYGATHAVVDKLARNAPYAITAMHSQSFPDFSSGRASMHRNLHRVAP